MAGAENTMSVENPTFRVRVGSEPVEPGIPNAGHENPQKVSKALLVDPDLWPGPAAPLDSKRAKRSDVKSISFVSKDLSTNNRDIISVYRKQ